jgi:hypothetical protein
MALAGEGIQLRRSEQSRQLTQKYIESQQQFMEWIVSYFTTHEAIDPKMYMEDLLSNKFKVDPISFKATAARTHYICMRP